MTYNTCFSNDLRVEYLSKGEMPCQDEALLNWSSRMRKDAGCVRWRRNIRRRIARSCAPRSFFLPPKGCKTRKSANALTCRDRWIPSGASDFFSNAWRGFRINPGAVDPAFFPPAVVLEVKALACELPQSRGLPFSRLSCADIAREAVTRGITASISGATVWRWLSNDAIRPWSHRGWIFPRDPRFAERADPVLDLYQGVWEGAPLGPADFVISADEKTSIQARRRIAPDQPTQPGQPRRVEFEYERQGALAYLAGWDVRRAKLFGLCDSSTGIDAFHRLVDLVMTQEPYRSARRVFWITDNGSSHRGMKAAQRLVEWYPQAIHVTTPVPASWLNQIEIYFSIVQRKALTPNNFTDLDTLEDHLLRFQAHYERIAQPFQWKFTRHDLMRLMERIGAPS